MTDRLFVYGSLAPQRENSHVVEQIGGEWSAGWLMGCLKSAGWGAALGYPGLVLAEPEQRIEGFVFQSANLEHHWPTLDAFEGEGYRRTRVSVTLDSGGTCDAWVYVLADT